MYKAQIFINYYILDHSNNVEHISKHVFNNLFWYRICRLLYGNINIHQLQNYYPSLPNLEIVFNRLQSLDNVNILVEKGDMIGYGQIVASACESVVTTYNNFYVENYENYIGNFFLYKLKVKYPVSS